MVGIKHESMRKGQTSHKKEHNTRMCFPLKPVFTRDKGGLPNFIDEPTTYLDIRYQIEILQLVKKLNQEFGITIIMVLHDINQAITYSDNIIGMKDGVVLVEGDPEEVITEESIRELYGIELGVTRVDGRKFVLTV